MRTRADAAARDDADPLRPFRDDFVGPDDALIYLDGNSLGRLSPVAASRIRKVVEEEWGRGLVRSWSRWVDLPTTIGDRIGAAIIGAGPGQVVVADSTTVSLYKTAAAALAARPQQHAVVTDGGNFPTDRYVLEGLCQTLPAELRFIDTDPVEGVSALDVADATSSGDVALVVLSHVDYRSGALADLAAVTEICHRHGALVLWDLSHSAGAVPIAVDASGVDLAVGCTYKYLNGGPGAPAFLYVRAGLQDELLQPIWGWFGQRDQFAMGPAYDPVAGIGSWLSGTPPVLGLAAVAEGVEGIATAGVAALREKSVALTELAIELADLWLSPLGATVASPRVASRRGGHIAVEHPEAWRICQALIDRYEVVPDYRPPNLIRLGPAPLYTRFVDVWDALDRLRQAIEIRAWADYPLAPGRIT